MNRQNCSNFLYQLQILLHFSFLCSNSTFDRVFCSIDAALLLRLVEGAVHLPVSLCYLPTTVSGLGMRSLSRADNHPFTKPVNQNAFRLSAQQLYSNGSGAYLCIRFSFTVSNLSAAVNCDLSEWTLRQPCFFFEVLRCHTGNATKR